VAWQATIYAMFATQLTSMMRLLAEVAPLNPGLAAEEETKRLIGIFVVLGMVALILKGFLIARWFANRKKRRKT
jgi:vacuolar-type H+-ATPase subunit I/STV1